jgi:FkbH-like protein
VHAQPVPPDFAQRLRAARAVATLADRLESLCELAKFDLGFLATIQLDRVLTAEAAGKVVAGFANLRLAVLGSSTLDHLLPPIRTAGLRHRMLIDTYLAPFGQYRQELLAPDAPLHRLLPDVLLLSLTAREAIGGITLDASVEQAERSLESWIGELRELWRLARGDSNRIVVQQTFLDTTEPVFGDFDRYVPGSPSRLVARLNERVADAAAREGVLLLDIARASARDGLHAWFDPARWLQGKIEIAPQSAQRYGELLTRLIAAQQGRSRKCLVLDLDNTLWGGTVGDDGVEGLVLGAGSAVGEAHLALQHHAKLLSERGVILAVCSKNDPAIAEQAFQTHPEMVLRRSDVACFVANWDDKSENLKSIAAQLNIGLDSLVFVDDNPAERARVRDSLPMVAVPELPSDPALFVRCIADGGYFDAVAFTADDRRRADQYTANARRESFLRSAQSMDDFLSALEMTLEFGEVSGVDLTRVTQLINKTNQFNPTTVRCSMGELADWIATPGCIALRFRLLDRFGDNGLISAMVLGPCGDAADALEVRLWVMSCRVFGRQVEDEAMNIAVESARQRGVRTIRAAYVPTPKNGVVASLYERLGFARDVAAPSALDATRWTLDVEHYATRPTHLRREAI